MAANMKAILDAIMHDASGDEIARLELPPTMRAATVHADEVDLFTDRAHNEKDPRQSIHIDEVPVPTPGPNEVLIAVMASAINFNTVWTSIFEPLPTFKFLEKLGKESEAGARHNLPYHILGSDACGVVLRTGPGVTRWSAGDRVLVHCNDVDLQRPEGHDDAMLDPGQRIWGFETNFGGLGEISLVKANQLMPKPAHLTWEEAASAPLVASTAYRMLVGRHGAQMKQGDHVLIWGATGGLGGYAVQLVRNGGGIPIGVVSSEKRARLARSLGCELVIDRKAEGYKFWTQPDADSSGGQSQPNPKEWARFGKKIRELTGGEDPDIVLEHPGRETFGASVFVCKRGGKVVTCASTSGYMHEYDNRYLWMHLKSIIGSHFANYEEAWLMNKLTRQGMIHPVMSQSFPLDETGEAANLVHTNQAEGKIGITVLAPEQGLGVTDSQLRAKHLDNITLFQRESQ